MGCGARLPMRGGEVQRRRAVVASHVGVGPTGSEQRGENVEGADGGREEEERLAIVQRRRVHVRPEAQAERDAVQARRGRVPLALRLAAVGGARGEQRGRAAGEVRPLQAPHLGSAMGAGAGWAEQVQLGRRGRCRCIMPHERGRSPSAECSLVISSSLVISPRFPSDHPLGGVLEQEQGGHGLARGARRVQGRVRLGVGDVDRGARVEEQAHARAQAARRRAVQAGQARGVLEVWRGGARQQGLDALGVPVLEREHQGGAAERVAAARRRAALEQQQHAVDLVRVGEQSTW